VGVKRQYRRTASRVENCQIDVFLCYASPDGAALIDRELYLPREWALDGERRKEADIPEHVGFATKPQLGVAMLVRALAADLRGAWVLGDSVYGSGRRLRRFLEEQGQPFVLAIPSNEPLWWQGPETWSARTIVAALAPEA